MTQQQGQQAGDWVGFPGGELEGKRPKALCPACREALARAARSGGQPARSAQSVQPGRTLCFQCYRAGLERDRAIKAAGALDTASNERFQAQLPFEPVNTPRLEALKAERAEARGVLPEYVDRRRHAQIAARHALAAIAAGLRRRGLAVPGDPEGDRLVFQSVHAAELQLPESWLPFVVAR